MNVCALSPNPQSFFGKNSWNVQPVEYHFTAPPLTYFPQNLYTRMTVEKVADRQCCYRMGGVRGLKAWARAGKSLVSQAAAGLLRGCSGSSSGSFSALSQTLAKRFKQSSRAVLPTPLTGAGDTMAPTFSWERDVMNGE